MKWTEIKEKQPDCDEFLVFDGYHITVGWKEDWNKKVTALTDNEITHWMPLPKEPQKGENNGRN